MGIATKAGLAGRWRIARRIADRIGPDARFDGFGVFQAAGDDLIWAEDGVFRIDGGGPMQAARRNIWRFHAGEIAVMYENGAPFHAFSSQAPSGAHQCDPDMYRFTYAFALPDEWRVEWRVTGPRKDYVSTSVMTAA